MISIILPWVREAGYQRCLSAIFDNVDMNLPFEVVAEEDIDRVGCNAMVNFLVGKSKYPIVCFMHDDSEPQPRFLSEALKVMNSFEGGWGTVGFNDLYHGRDGPPTHWMIHKKMLQYFPDGVFYSEEYIHTRVDQELKDVSEAAGRYKWAEKAKVIHYSLVNAGKHDDLAKHCYSRKSIAHDLEVYNRRKGER